MGWFPEHSQHKAEQQSILYSMIRDLLIWMVYLRTESSADEACLPYCCLSIPSSSDLAFDVVAYTFILLNDAFTAASNVYTKKNIGPEVLLSVLVTQWEKVFCSSFGSRKTWNLFLKSETQHCCPATRLPCQTGREKAVELYAFLLRLCWCTKVGSRCLSIHINSMSIRKNIFNLTLTLQRLIKCGLGFDKVHFWIKKDLELSAASNH